MGNRGTIEINPRDTMAKESSIIGVALSLATEVYLEEYGYHLQISMTSSGYQKIFV